MPNCPISFTIHIRALESNTAKMPSRPLRVGSRKNRIILRNPRAKIALTSGKTNTVQMAVSGLIV